MSRCNFTSPTNPILLKALTLAMILIPTLSTTASQTVTSQGLNSPIMTYQKPEPIISDLAVAMESPALLRNSTGTHLFKIYNERYPDLDHFVRPVVKVAGHRFFANSTVDYRSGYNKKLVILDVKTKKEKEVIFRKNSKFWSPQLSPDGKLFAIRVENQGKLELWMGETETAKVKQVKGVNLQTLTPSSPFEWINNKELLAGHRVNEKVNLNPVVPVGPNVRETGAGAKQNRTYQDLIKNEGDAEIFRKYITTQLVKVNAKTGAISKLRKPILLDDFAVSPDSQWIRVSEFTGETSTVVPSGFFANRVSIWSKDGKKTLEWTSRETIENLPIQGVPTGPRSYRWLATQPSTILYVEALDGGDWNTKVDFRDRLMMVAVNEKGISKPTEIIKLKNRYMGLSTIDLNGQELFVSQYDRDKMWMTTDWVGLNGKVTKQLWSRSLNDEYGDPGNMVTEPDESGWRTVFYSKDDKKNTWVYLDGQGATTDGELPFLRKFCLETGETEEIFRSAKDAYESFLFFLPNPRLSAAGQKAAPMMGQTIFLTSFQTKSVAPMYYLRTGGKSELTVFLKEPNAWEIFTKVKKELLKFERADKVKLTGVLYYPSDYVEGKKYPVIVDAYPVEYTDASTAGQTRGTTNTYSRPSGSDVRFFTLRGYAVLSHAQMPVVGPPETVNDTFIDQIKMNAEAIRTALKTNGISDGTGLGVMGHSYGAFMVANLLTHSDVFSAGIARSGAYNRTLTPFGFQSERRPYWAAPETYMKVSPFHSANQMKRPLLLIHGEVDENSGTFTVQSERYFDAISGNLAATQAKARLVVLPYEGHGYRARESVRHVLWEMFQWADRYLKK